ncbi:MAG: hypothetical protein ACTSQI_01455 [Candidatus Helarchaeota archaeon]
MIYNNLRKKERKWMDKVRELLYETKEQHNLESCTLTHRTAGPLESAGTWISKDEVYGMCSTAMHIFFLGDTIYESTIIYTVVKVDDEILFMAPIPNFEYFLILNVPPKIDYGDLFRNLKNHLIPTIISLLGRAENPFLNRFIFQAQEKTFMKYELGKNCSEVKPKIIAPVQNIEIDCKVSNHVRDLVFDCLKTNSEISSVEIILAGGIPFCSFSVDPRFEKVQKESFNLFNDANLYLSKNMHKSLKMLLFESTGYSYLIYGLIGGIFSTIFENYGGDHTQIQYYATQVEKHLLQIA